MQTYLALLRGINVSGQKLIKMEALRSAMESAGFQNVKTYIQSGNIIFDSGHPVLPSQIAEIIKEAFGFEVGVVIRTRSELARTIEMNPYNNQDGKIYFAFLSQVPSEEAVQKWNSAETGKDQSLINGDVMYINYREGAGNSKLTNALIENKLRVVSTMRNWNTVHKLLELLD